MEKFFNTMVFAAAGLALGARAEVIVAHPQEKNSGITINGEKVGDVKYGDGWFLNSGVLQIGSGDWTLSGTNTKGVVRVKVLADANITLKNLCIKTPGKNVSAFVLQDGVTVNMYLSGTNQLASGKTGAGINVPGKATLNIYGPGQVLAEGGKYGAGIGGNNYEGGLSPDTLKCGTINIYGGEVLAVGGDYSAGIGGGSGERCGTDLFLPGGNGGTVTINGGNIVAYGGPMGAGIGGGWKGYSGWITINGGDVYCKAGGYGAGIGGGSSMGRRDWVGVNHVTITGGRVIAKGHAGGSGIGSGYFGAQGGRIDISGGYVEAFGGTFVGWVDGRDVGGAAIGGGFKGSGGPVYVSGGTVRTQPGTGAAHFGCGLEAVMNEDNKLVVTGGSIEATPNTGTSAKPVDGKGVPLFQVTVGGLKWRQPVTLEGIDGYGGTDLVPDAKGCVYLWLKPRDEKYAFTCGGHEYEARVDYANTYAHFTESEERKEYVRKNGTTFDVNGGDDSAGELLMLYEDSDIYGSFPYRPSRDAWWFTGWYTAADGGTRKFESDAPTKHETLYAHWQMNVGSSRTAFYASQGCKFSRQGGERWFAQTDVVHESAQAMRSNVIGPNESTEMYLDEFVGPGEASFWWNARSGPTDSLSFRIDDETVAVCGLRNVWKQFTVSIPAGKHKLSWVFARGEPDSSGDNYDSCGYVTEFSFVPERPSNDDFADAEALDPAENVAVDGCNNIYSTLEPGEAKGWNAATNSVWYSWTPPAAAPSARVCVRGLDFAPAVKVCTGDDVSSLVTVAEMQGGSSSRFAEVEFVPAAGTKYMIRVSGSLGVPVMGNFELKCWLSNSEPSWVPANDRFANADRWAGQASMQGLRFSTTGAGYEENEPLALFEPSATNSVWLKWTALFTGDASFDTLGSSFMTVMGVYQIDDDDTAFENVRTVAENKCATGVAGWYSRCHFQCVLGEAYYVCVAGLNGATGNLKLNWSATKAETIPVVFAANDGSGGATTNVYANEQVGIDNVPTPEREGYTFDGWYDAPEGGSPVVAEGFEVLAPVTFYAHWTPISYDVEFDKNYEEAVPSANVIGGVRPAYKANGVNPRQKFSYDTWGKLDANVFTRAGYAFAGWNTEADGSGDSYADGEEAYNLTATAGGVVMLYAQWKANPYTIVFEPGVNDAGGTTPSQAVEVGKVARLNPCGFVHPSGGKFVGWRRVDTGRRYDDGVMVFNLAAPDGTVVMEAVWE